MTGTKSACDATSCSGMCCFRNSKGLDHSTMSFPQTMNIYWRLVSQHALQQSCQGSRRWVGHEACAIVYCICQATSLCCFVYEWASCFPSCKFDKRRCYPMIPNAIMMNAFRVKNALYELGTAWAFPSTTSSWPKIYRIRHWLAEASKWSFERVMNLAGPSNSPLTGWSRF